MLISFGLFAATEMIIILIISLIIFGPGKLPKLGKSLGRGINEFRTASQEPIKMVVNIVTQKDAVKDTEDNW